jgi:hypothetical protein
MDPGEAMNALVILIVSLWAVVTSLTALTLLLGPGSSRDPAGASRGRRLGLE